MSVILLLDNGSLQAEATKQLRQLAHALSLKCGQTIHPVSLQHADKIPPTDLEGLPAQTFVVFMQQHLSQGERDFIILPLFFGESRAVTTFIPSEIATLKALFGDFNIAIADVLYPLPEGEPQLVNIIYENTLATAETHHVPLKNIVLVDHGSPVPRVTEVREHIANQIQTKFADNIQIDQAVMERREGVEYDFNGILLEDWLMKKAASGESTAIVTLLFFLAGRHAGKGGDIQQICEKVMRKYPDFTIVISPLVSEHKDLLLILHERFQPPSTH
ncbi:MAG: cobalamin biosynthesis protein CbiX [Aquificaceae bacterium]|nr:MAG: cobalamin biosynthesis protein CbiX [Aquificaceae bacterium]